MEECNEEVRGGGLGERNEEVERMGKYIRRGKGREGGDGETKSCGGRRIYI